MKKSTLFFKVMVLLALLVPWTGWGRLANLMKKLVPLRFIWMKTGICQKQRMELLQQV